MKALYCFRVGIRAESSEEQGFVTFGAFTSVVVLLTLHWTRFKQR